MKHNLETLREAIVSYNNPKGELEALASELRERYRCQDTCSTLDRRGRKALMNLIKEILGE